MLAAAGAIVAALIIGEGARRQVPMAVESFTAPYYMRHLDDPLELLLVRSDGQAYANIARDPLLRRAASDFHSPEEAAYRAQRPLAAYAAWAMSFGQPHLVPSALALLAVAGAGLAVSGVGALLVRRTSPPWYALAIVPLPGFYFSTLFLLPEPLALGLASWGIYAWERNRFLLAGVLMTLAAMTRETMLIAFGVLLLVALWQRRGPAVLAAAAPFVAVTAWFGLLAARFGSLPTAGGGSGRLGWPLQGLREALASGSAVAESGNLVFAATFVALVLAAFLRSRDDLLTWISVTYLAFISLSGHLVWQEAGFGRISLPMAAFALVAIFAQISAGSVRCRGAAGVGSTRRPRTHWPEPGSLAVAPAPPCG